MRSSPPLRCNRDLPATTRTRAKSARATRKPSPSSAWLGWAESPDNKIEDVRLAIGSMAVTPLRLRRTEEVLLGRAWSPALVREARQALETEVAPIDDIRSSAAYRLHVAGNLLQEFLEGLFQ